MSTECIAIIGAIATVLAAFGGAALGAWFAYKTGVKLIQRQEFNKAAVNFRNAFIPEIIFLKHHANVAGSNASDDVGQSLSFGHLHRHLQAFETFKTYLSAKDKTAINKVWKDYCCDPNNPENICFGQYSYKPSEATPERTAEIKQVALERIEALLKFAEPMK